MALDIGIQSDDTSIDPLERDLVVSLEEGEMAFLFEVFEEIESVLGIQIVPWDDAMLSGEQLALLSKLLRKKIEIANNKPDKWEEYIGFRLSPKKEKIDMFVTLKKSNLLKKLSDLETLIFRAEMQRKVLFFFGD